MQVLIERTRMHKYEAYTLDLTCP